jgi:adenylylsulfate kinase
MYQFDVFKDDYNIRGRNTVWHKPDIHRADRELLNKHRSSVLWFTGYSASGKSTLANATEKWFHTQGIRTYILDGDNIRQGLCSDLDFSKKARTENMRRIGEVSKLMMEAGVVVLTAFISPFRRDREMVREMIGPGDFIEIFCDVPLAVCEQRDPKGLYKRARKGEIPYFTGISSPYEAPLRPEVILRTGEIDCEECVNRIQEYMMREGRLYLNQHRKLP